MLIPARHDLNTYLKQSGAWKECASKLKKEEIPNASIIRRRKSFVRVGKCGQTGRSRSVLLFGNQLKLISINPFLFERLIQRYAFKPK